jgi:hypothetical protein
VSKQAAGAAGDGKRRTGLRHRLEHYAAEYESALRTVKRWVADGKAAGDPCPLDDPEALLAWWSRNKRQVAPAGINAAVVRARKSAPIVPKAPAPVIPEGELPLVPAAAVEEPVVPEIVIPEGRGLQAELARLEDLAARLSAQAHLPGQAKNYLDALARMGAISEKLRIEAERLGKLLPRDQVSEVLHAFHGPIESGVRGLVATMCEVLGVELTPEREEAWNLACDGLFVRFKEEVLR